MICIDSSALVAIIKGESERRSFIDVIDRADAAFVSTANYLEASMVCESAKRAPGNAMFQAEMQNLHRLGLMLVAFDETQAELAREGFRRYGKGRHPAGLNFGDCFAYGLAKALDAPLLYKGTDFDKTDIRRA